MKMILQRKGCIFSSRSEAIRELFKICQFPQIFKVFQIFDFQDIKLLFITIYKKYLKIFSFNHHAFLIFFEIAVLSLNFDNCQFLVRVAQAQKVIFFYWWSRNFPHFFTIYQNFWDHKIKDVHKTMYLISCQKKSYFLANSYVIQNIFKTSILTLSIFRLKYVLVFYFHEIQIFTSFAFF